MDNNLFNDAVKLQRQFINSAEKLKDDSKKSLLDVQESTQLPRPEKKMIYETENSLVIVLRIPWAEAKDVKIIYELKQVEIKIENQTKKYHKLLVLPCYVVPHAGRATFSHEILRVELPKYKNTKTLMPIEQ